MVESEPQPAAAPAPPAAPPQAAADKPPPTSPGTAGGEGLRIPLRPTLKVTALEEFTNAKATIHKTAEAMTREERDKSIATSRGESGLGDVPAAETPA